MVRPFCLQHFSREIHGSGPVPHPAKVHCEGQYCQQLDSARDPLWDRCFSVRFSKKTAQTVKTSFVTSEFQYIGYLLDAILRQSGLNSDIVKGLAAFDPFILHKRPTEVALRHFETLYTTFLLRSWVTSAVEFIYRTEYLELLDYLRSTYLPNFDFTETSQDLIGFLTGLEFLHDRPRLLYMFKLCCLCLTTSSPT